MSILDAFPYPWADRSAQDLHIRLTRLYPTPSRATMVAERSGIDLGYVDAGQPPVLLWHDLLDLAAQSGLTRRLIATSRDLLAPLSPERPFLEDLLASVATPVSAEPHYIDGRPSFLTADDSISEPEALLFWDDLTIETGRLPALINTLKALVELATAVCLVRSTFGPNTVATGTGFRIGPNSILTNWHVLHDAYSSGQLATSADFEFRYEDDGDGGGRATRAYRGDMSSVKTDRQDDWAVIRLVGDLEVEFATIKLSDAAEPVRNEAAFIVQHPRGRRKRVAYVRNQVSDFDTRVLHYLTDTETGSSGSPVFNASGRLIGLHHAGGNPQIVLGQPPLAKNEAIRIPRVQAGLTRNSIQWS